MAFAVCHSCPELTASHSPVGQLLHSFSPAVQPHVMRIWSGLHLNPISIKLSQLQGVDLPIALGIVLDPFHCSMEYTEDEVILEKKRPWLHPSCYQLQNLTPLNTSCPSMQLAGCSKASQTLIWPVTCCTTLHVSSAYSGCVQETQACFCAALLFLPLPRNCRHCCEYGVSALILADNHKVTLLSCCPGVRKTISYPALPLQSVSITNLLWFREVCVDSELSLCSCTKHTGCYDRSRMWTCICLHVCPTRSVTCSLLAVG